MKTIRSEMVGKNELRLVDMGQGLVGIVIAGGGIKTQIAGTDATEVWHRLLNEAGKTSPRYFGITGARKSFLDKFPQGFRSKEYAEMERDYKILAKAKLDQTAPLELAENSQGLGEAILSAYQSTNLLSQFENMRVRDVLRGPSADQFVKAIAKFAVNPSKHLLQELEHILKPHDAAKWTIVTYLPFLWNPKEHMYLKPTVTKDFAERIGHPFVNTYEAKLIYPVYESLLDLAEKTEQALADLEPQDRIDIQSFIWIIGGAYDNLDDLE